VIKKAWHMPGFFVPKQRKKVPFSGTYKCEQKIARYIILSAGNKKA
jgi:hypothetical protein